MRSRFPKGCRALTTAGVLACAPLSAAAEDYPYSGLFWLAVESSAIADLDRRCALSFLDQRADGSWAVYHADLDEFATSATLVYRKLSEGQCKYTPETRVEACVATMDKSFPEGEGQMVYDVVTLVADQQIDTVMIDAASGWETVMQDPTNSDAGFQLTYLRCPYPAEALLSRISAEPTTISAEDLTALRFPAEDLVVSPQVTALVAALRGQ